MITNIINMFKKTWKYLIIALIAVAIIRYYIGPTFFDIFGILIFLGLVLIGLWELYSDKPMPDWLAFAIIVVGLFGLIVDGATSFVLFKQWILRG